MLLVACTTFWILSELNKRTFLNGSFPPTARFANPKDQLDGSEILGNISHIIWASRKACATGLISIPMLTDLEVFLTSMKAFGICVPFSLMKALKCKTLGGIHIHHALSHIHSKCQGPSIHTIAIDEIPIDRLCIYCACAYECLAAPCRPLPVSRLFHDGCTSS